MLAPKAEVVVSVDVATGNVNEGLSISALSKSALDKIGETAAADVARLALSAVARELANALAELVKKAPPPLDAVLGPLGSAAQAALQAANGARGNRELAEKLGVSMAEAWRRAYELLAKGL